MTSEAVSSDRVPAPPRTSRWRRRVAWVIGGLLLATLLVLLAAGGGLWWSLRSDPGSAWVLAQLPGVKVTRGQGTLWGDYEAERVEFQIPNGVGKVIVQGVGWRGLRVQRASWASYGARIVMNELHARRVDLVLAPSDKKEPLQPPADLRLPVALDVASVKVSEFYATALGDKPLRDLQAKLDLGAARGTQHRIDALSLVWDRLKAKGALHIGAVAPFNVAANIELAQDAVEPLPAWNARAALEGPLERPTLAADLRAGAIAGRPQQTLSARAGLRPFAEWPLGELQARTQALDLSAFHASLPITSLSGNADASTTGRDQPASLHAHFVNDAAGRWNEGRLPVRTVDVNLSARPDDARTLDVRAVDAELGTAQQAGGRVQGSGQWTGKGWKFDATLSAVQPLLLDARAAAMALSGPVSVTSAASGGVDVKADLAGQFAGRGPARAARVAANASVSPLRIEVRELNASAGGAKASVQGLAVRDTDAAPWKLNGDAKLVDFDPAPWWPGRDAAWRKGPNRINAKAQFDLALPAVKEGQSLVDAWPALRGRASASWSNSVLMGVRASGDIVLRSADDGVALASVALDAAGNTLRADGRLNAGPNGAGDRWDVALAAPHLDSLAPLWRLAAGGGIENNAFAGAVNATAHVTGRWPDIASQGQLEANGVRAGPTRLQRAQARWNFDSTAPQANVDVQVALTQIAIDPALAPGVPPIDSAQLALTGTTRAHTLELRAETKALPPAWTQVAARTPPGTLPPAPATSASSNARSVGVLRVQGGVIDAAPTRGSARFAGWRGTLQQLELRSTLASEPPWLRTRDIGIEVQSAPARVAVLPGRAEVLGAALRWSRIAWQAAAGREPAQLEAQADLEPLTIAPLLSRIQPDFGWGGDLAVAGHLKVKSTPTFSADVVLERQRGDLTVTDETGTVQALGLTDLRLGLDANNGTWNFTQGLAGKTLGVAAGAVVARTSPQATWPTPETPIQGVLEVQVANLGTWGTWVPAGWRLAGTLRTSASIAGRFGAPEYTGQMRGSGLGVRNFLEGVNITDGDVAIALKGDSAQIERFTAKAGAGTMRLEGNARLGEAPKALVRVQADKFLLLGRVDRRIVASGQAQLELDRSNLALNGTFGVDEGLFDFTRSDAPRLSDDVHVIRGKSKPVDTAAANGNPNPAPGHAVNLNLRVSLGQQLRVRGRGIDSGLRGELQITSPSNRLAINGTVRAVDGTYAAYSQKLEIERGLITFVGPAENPRLDILATRANSDVRVGVNVTGTALNPRIRLFSEPEMAEIDKLSWLVLGRATDGLGRTDTALLQRAAIALLSGEGEGMTTQLTKAIGLDDVSLRQTEGEVRETVISLGKQLSRRWYVGYERSLSATAGTWQIIYRIAQRFTLRAQTGQDTSLDVIWTWRWQ